MVVVREVTASSISSGVEGALLAGKVVVRQVENFSQSAALWYLKEKELEAVSGPRIGLSAIKGI